AERIAAVYANATDRGRVLEEAKAQAGVAFHLMPNAAPAPMAPARSEPAGMMGAMGGMGGGRMAGQMERQLGELRRDKSAKMDSELAAKELSESLADRPALGMRSARRAWARKADAAPIQPRERFVETAYWNPSVVTGKDGKARVSFKAPAA